MSTLLGVAPGVAVVVVSVVACTIAMIEGETARRRDVQVWFGARGVVLAVVVLAIIGARFVSLAT